MKKAMKYLFGTRYGSWMFLPDAVLKSKERCRQILYRRYRTYYR